DCTVSRFETCCTDCCRNDDVDFGCRSNLTESLSTCYHFRNRNVQRRATASEFLYATTVRNRHYLGPEYRGLLRQTFDGRVCPKGKNVEAVGQMLDDAQRVLPYGSGRTNDCESFHELKNQ